MTKLGSSTAKNWSRSKKLSAVIFISTCLLLLVAAVVVAVASSRRNRSHSTSPGHAVVKSACNTTLYPDLCYSTLAAAPGVTDSVATHKDVIEAALIVSTGIVERSYFATQKVLTSKKGLSKREKTALHDCLEMVDETLDELRQALADVRQYPNRKKSLEQHADDLKTLMSATMTNQETCLDGFSHGSADASLRREAVQDVEQRGERMCSNALAMIKSMTDADIAAAEQYRSVEQRRLKEDAGVGARGWPEWVSARDRRLLLQADVVVAADGSGNYTTVMEAVEGAPKQSDKRYVIRIKAGVYRENVEVSKKKTNLMFVGDGRNVTIITGSRNVVDGSTTFKSATVAVVGAGFMARGITFENTAGPSKHQAVALRVGSDLSAFYECDMLAYQDTLYAHSNRQFYINCLIAGTVDFIFGNGAAVFQDCDIHARLPGPGQKNMLTAQGRFDPNQNTGIVIHKCRIGATEELRPVQANFSTFIGRPWKNYSRTVVMGTTISDVIHPAGWHEWDGDFALGTLYYGEYNNSGTGADTDGRVKWAGFKVIDNATEAQLFTPREFIAGRTWLPSTGFPYSLDL